MPEEQIVEQTAAPQPDEQTQPEAQEEELAEETKEEQEKKEEERKRKRTVTLLTALLLICLIAEVSLASYIGLTLYQNIQNQRILTAQYEAYVAWQESAESAVYRTYGPCGGRRAGRQLCRRKRRPQPGAE